MARTSAANRLGGVSALQSFAQSVRTPQSGVNLYWLGQAGFLLVTPDGVRIAIDPYLTDYCERVVGFHRLMAPVAAADSFACDILLLSHAHEDHCDMDLLSVMAERKSQTKVLATKNCVERMTGLSLCVIPFDRGSVWKERGVRIVAVDCDHGESAADAVGFVIEAGGQTVYFAGDTCLNRTVLERAAAYKPDVALLPINGEYGNLDALQAAQAADAIGAAILVPCHYWMFAEHGAHPIELLQQGPALCPNTQILWLAQGEGVNFTDEQA